MELEEITGAAAMLVNIQGQYHQEMQKGGSKTQPVLSCPFLSSRPADIPEISYHKRELLASSRHDNLPFTFFSCKPK